MAAKYREYLKQQIENPDFKMEYDALEAEYRIIQAMIDARKKSGRTQKELSEKTGIAQNDISRLESGNGNPSIRTLRRLAAGMNMTLTIDFKPVKTRD